MRGYQKIYEILQTPNFLQSPFKPYYWIRLGTGHPAEHNRVDENFADKDNRFGPDLKLISEFETYKLIKKFSKKAIGPGDFPKRILSEFAVELALP